MHSSDISKLKQYIERIEHLEDEKAELQESITDVYHEAKGDGFDVKVMKKVIRLKKMKTEDRVNEDLLLDTYMVALGLVPSDEGPEEN